MCSTMDRPPPILKICYMVMLAMTSAYACVSDHDCARPNTYCYDTRQCVNCTDCNIFQRQPGKGCAKDRNQCGPCLPGMESDENIDGSLATCYVSPTTKQTVKEENSINNWFNIAAFAVIVFFVFLSIFVCVFKKKIANKVSKYVCEFRGQNCPQEMRVIPSAPKFEDMQYQPVTASVMKFENEQTQQAKPFKNPYYVRNGSVQPQQEEQSTPILEEQGEETTPSNWVPFPNETESLPTDFRNILAISPNQATTSQVESAPNLNVGVQAQGTNQSNASGSHFNERANDNNRTRIENNTVNIICSVNLQRK